MRTVRVTGAFRRRHARARRLRGRGKERADGRRYQRQRGIAHAAPRKTARLGAISRGIGSGPVPTKSGSGFATCSRPTSLRSVQRWA